MNERIRELAEQARLGRGPEKIHISENGVVIFYLDELEKFAELIVRECIGCCEQVISDPVPKTVDTWLNGGEQCIDEIKNHFGVEE